MANTHKRYDWVMLQREYDSGKSYLMLTSEFGVCVASLRAAAKRGDFTPRSRRAAFDVARDSGRIDHKSAWTPERRRKQSDAKKKLYAMFPEKHPNRKLANNRTRMSFPERIVFDYLTATGVSFEHNRQIDKYFVDFCIGSLVVEVDGAAFHDVEYDRIRDEIIASYGFTIRRFSASDILKYGASIVLANDSELVGIMSNHIDLRKEKICVECGGIHYTPNMTCSSECSALYIGKINMAQRKVERPDAETLTALMETESFVSIGKKFGVSDNSVRKWCKAYGIDTKRRAELSDDDVRVMIESGSGVTSIANHFGVTRERIKGIADRLGVELTDHTAVEYAPELVSKVADLIKQGYRNVDIIPLVGLTQKQISAIRCRIDR